jgi:hypothetical protein
MKLHVDERNPTIILDEHNRPVAETGIQAGFDNNVKLAKAIVDAVNEALH